MSKNAFAAPLMPSKTTTSLLIEEGNPEFQIIVALTPLGLYGDRQSNKKLNRNFGISHKNIFTPILLT